MTRKAWNAKALKAKRAMADDAKPKAASANGASAQNAMAKRLLSVLMAVVLAVGLMPLPAFAAGGGDAGAQVAGGAKLAAGSLTLGAQAEGYGVSIATKDASSGLVAYSYNGGDYVGPSESLLLIGAAESTVAVKAEPRYGWEFACWKEGGGVVSTDNPYTFTPTQSRSLTATFAWSSDAYCPPPMLKVDGMSVVSSSRSAQDIGTSKITTSGYGTIEMRKSSMATDKAQIHYLLANGVPKDFSGSLGRYVDETSLFQTATGGFRPQANQYDETLVAPMGTSYLKFVMLDEQDASVFPYVFKKRSEEYVIEINRVAPTLQYSCVSIKGTVSGTAPGEHDVGTEVTVKASPAEGYKFLGWVDAYTEKTVSTKAEYSFTLEKSTSLVALFAIRSGVAIDEANFPDAAFRSFVKTTFDTDNDKWLDESESANVTEMSCTNKGIVSIQGIENFPSLKTLNVSNNRITAVDISSLAVLEVLKAGSNQIETINLSANPALRELNLDTNKLAAIDVSKLPELTKLLVYNNDLAALDVTGNPLLANLQCHGNEFTQLDLRSSDYLKQAVLAGTKDASNSAYDNYSKTVNCTYTTLRVDKNVELTCEDGVAISESNFPDAAFRTFVVDYDTNNSGKLTADEIAAITYMDCSDQGIASLRGIEHFTALGYLDCSKNSLTSLDVSANSALQELECSKNNLTALDTNAELTILMCGDNKLAGLDVSENTALQLLDYSYNQISSLDVSGNTALMGLGCDGNEITTLDLSKNAELMILSCRENNLATLDVSANTALMMLDCSYNPLGSLNVSGNTAITELGCAGTGISSLDVSGLAALESLYCDDNDIAVLDVSKNTALTDLSCSGNKLTSFDVSANTALKSLECTDNALTALDVSGLAALENLKCTNNKLAWLELPQNGVLNYLECYGNQLDFLDVSATSVLKGIVEAGEPQELEDHLWYPSTDGLLRVDKGTAVFTTPVYRVEVASDAGGAATASPAYGTEGTEVALAATPNEGYEFAGWQVVSGNVTLASSDDATTTFAIGSEHMKVKATWKTDRETPDHDPNPNPDPSPNPNPNPAPSPDPSPEPAPAPSPSPDPAPSPAAKAKVAKAPAAKKGLVFTGKTQALATAGKASGGTIHYSLDGKTWSAKIPTAKKAGTYTVRYKAASTSANGTDGAVGKLKATIAKAKNTMTVKGKKANVSAKKLAKKAQTVKRAKAFKVKKAKGKLSFKKAKGAKKISVAKNGTLKVKKGTRAGTYKLKVKVTAKGNANYKKQTKTVSVKVVVK